MENTTQPALQADIKHHIAQALGHLNRNDAASAEFALLAALDLSKEDAQALQLLGVVRRMQGRNDEAETLYRRSLAVDPQQPNVHHNLGNLLSSTGRFEEAVVEQREAVRLRSNYFEAHLNLAIALSLAGRHAEAEKSCRAALRVQPNSLFAKQTLAGELNELGRAKEAETILRQAIALAPNDQRQLAALEHNLGMSLRKQQRYEEAMAQFDAAQAKVPEMPAVEHNRANTLQQLGRLDEAVESYRRALQREPLNLDTHRNLNQLLYRLGNDESFLKSSDTASAIYPELADFPLEKANFLLLKGDHVAAREAYERACHLAPQSVRAHDGLGLILARLGEFEHGTREHRTALAINPSDAFAWRNFAETLLRAGDAKGALEATERSLALEPQNQGAVAMWGVALRASGDPRDEELNDYEQFVRVYEISPPAGYSDVETFNRDLNAYLDTLHRDRREAIDQTLRGGSQTLDDFFGKGHAPAELLRARIDEAVADYIGRMKESATHPLLKRKAREFDYAASWSARLQDCGFHTNHVHSKGWISSAYYVALPDAVDKPGANEGWIKFGEPNFECGLKNPVRREVQPKVGRLVLFPSYMWHGTVPFHSKESRTTVAFDVVPRGT